MNSLLLPMYVMVLLTFAVAVRLFITRVKAVRSGAIKMSYFKALTGEMPSEEAAIAARHFTNLFEVPVLFYVACIVALVLNAQTATLIGLAWLFVVCRALQAIIHLTYNKVRHRFVAYFSGFLVVLVMWTILIVRQL